MFYEPFLYQIRNRDSYLSDTKEAYYLDLSWPDLTVSPAMFMKGIFCCSSGSKIFTGI